MNNEWKNKIALVTGASAGIGAKIAKDLANIGMTVIGIARRSELIENLNAEIEDNDGKIVAIKCDITDAEEVLKTFEWIKNEYGTINVFVNNAGIMKAAFLLNTSNDDIKESFDSNVISCCICVREAVKLMQDNQTKGHIILINSILGHRIPDVPLPLFNVYPSTKHAITALCQTVRQEIHFNKLNIKLTSINPGMVDTDFLKVYKSSAYDLMPKLQPEDVSNAVLYVLNTPDYVQIEDITLQAMFRHD